MVSVHGTPCAVPPRNSNSTSCSCSYRLRVNPYINLTTSWLGLQTSGPNKSQLQLDSCYLFRSDTQHLGLLLKCVTLRDQTPTGGHNHSVYYTYILCVLCKERLKGYTPLSKINDYKFYSFVGEHNYIIKCHSLIPATPKIWMQKEK
jgi:hypothetical protein